MKTRIAIIVLTISTFTAGIAEAGHKLLGLNLGTSIYSRDEATQATTNLTGDAASLIPGIRLGYTDDDNSIEGTLDLSGFFEPARGGQPHRYDYTIMVGADDAMKTWDTTSLFISVGLGYQNLDRDVWSKGREIYGAGLGLRRSVSEDHGALRMEVRFDHAPERSVSSGSGDEVVLPETNAVSLKLGFDLRLY